MYDLRQAGFAIDQLQIDPIKWDVLAVITKWMKQQEQKREDEKWKALGLTKK